MKRPQLLALAVAVVLVAASCGGGGNRGGSGHADGTGGFSALPANFDLAVDSPQPFLVALAGPERRSVAYGAVAVALYYLGPVGRPVAAPRPGPTATAAFRPAAGVTPGPVTGDAQLLDRTDTSGVYATEPLTFPDPGYWEATVRFTIGGTARRVTAAFEVLARHLVPAVGDRAPATANPLAGDPAVPPVAVDSRAADGTIPDVDLHRVTVADALAAWPAPDRRDRHARVLREPAVRPHHRRGGGRRRPPR